MKLRISSSWARVILLLVWAFFFSFNIGSLLYLYLDKWIEQDNLKAGLLQLNSVYVTYLGVMIAFFFKDRNSVAGKKPAGGPFVLAFLCSLGWNVFISIFIVRLLLQLGAIEDSIAQIGDFGPLMSWLVAPAIGYYFAQSAK